MSRARLYRYVDAGAWGKKGLSPFNMVICISILLAVGIAIVETERPILDANPTFFRVAETVFFFIFLVEYALRIYVAPENPKYQRRFGRLRYMLSGWALLDLVALASFLAPFVSNTTAFYFRLSRIARILRVSRLGRFSHAWELLWKAASKRRFELLMSGVVAGTLLLLSSACLYLFEAGPQPEAFGSIPRALWWSVATLTTVGYGDVTPITAPGQFFAGLTAITGIGIVAMPTGILAAAFSEAFQERDRIESERKNRSVKRGGRKEE